jgi:hypothetical protein
MMHQKRRATEQECAVFTSLLGEIVAARSKRSCMKIFFLLLRKAW